MSRGWKTIKSFSIFLICMGSALMVRAYDPVEAVMQGGDADIVQFTNTPSFPTGMEINGAFYNSYGNFSFDSFVPNSQIDGSSITKQGNTFNGMNELLQLGNTGQIPNSALNGSSVTLQGNTFNGNNQLLELNATGGIPNAQLNFQGRNTNSFQPSFLAYNSATRSNVTGDNSTVTVTFDTEQYDQASNFASNTFTAPVTGHYLLSTGVTFRDETVGNKCEVKIVTTARTFTQEYWPSSNISIDLTVIAAMSVSDTAIITLNCSGGAKVVDIMGSNTTTTGSGEPTFFSGTLLN